MTFPTGTPSRWFHARPAPRRRPCRRHTAWLLAAAACGGTTDIITPPPPPPATFVLQFAADPDDASTAQAMGWQNGIPDVDFVLRPADTTAGGSQTFRGSPQGSATLTGVVPGRYLVTATRWMTSSERARLSAADDATGFLAKTEVEVTASGSRTVSMNANRRRSLVISEWAFNWGTVIGVGVYNYGGFLEIYNNADTTIYLDGMLIAEGYSRDLDYPVTPCVETAAFREDPAGVWTRFFQAFPGSGRSFPIEPGQTKVIATDAIDHRPLLPGAIDLSGADFEFTGTPDVDNPAVPNMVDVGLTNYQAGHGLHWPGLGAVAVLALPTESDQLTRANAHGVPYARIPRDRVLDVLWLRSNLANPPVAECPRLLPPNIDRRGSSVRGTDEVSEYRYSVSRVKASVTFGGRPALQHTRDSYADSERTPRTPGRTP